MTIKSPPPRHYAKSEKALAQLLGRSLLERQHIARKFLSARQQLRWTHQECAQVLRVTTRTLRYWEAAEVRIPHAAYKLMRVLASGRYLGDAWRNFFVRGDVLVTPEGHQFPAGDLAWWSLCIRQADAFRDIMHKQRQAQRQGAAATNGATATVGAAAPTPLATVMRDHVGSKASTSRGKRPAAQEDPSALQMQASGAPQEHAGKMPPGAGQRLDKSLNNKRIPPESLSLTLPNRPANPSIDTPRSQLDQPSPAVCACGHQVVAP